MGYEDCEPIEFDGTDLFYQCQCQAVEDNSQNPGSPQYVRLSNSPSRIEPKIEKLESTDTQP